MKAELRRWCEENSKAIDFFKHLCMPPQKISRGNKISLKKPGVMEHFASLATPVSRDYATEHCRTPEEMNIKKSALSYKATDRITSLSQPLFLPRTGFIHYREVCISKAALTHKLTNRENALAQPSKRRNPKARDYTKVSKAALKHNPGDVETRLSKNYKRNITRKWKARQERYVKKAALSAEASARVQELAGPRDRKDRCTKPHPFDVSKGALNALASERTQKLATAKRHTPKYVNRVEQLWLAYFSSPNPMCAHRLKKARIAEAKAKRDQKRRMAKLKKRQEKEENPDEGKKKKKDKEQKGKK